MGRPLPDSFPGRERVQFSSVGLTIFLQKFSDVSVQKLTMYLALRKKIYAVLLLLPDLRYGFLNSVGSLKQYLLAEQRLSCCIK